MGWKHPILTDSGGFQVYSLASLRRIDEEGVSFRSPVDGAADSHAARGRHGRAARAASDIAMAFDECTGYPATHEQARESMQRSMRWALRSYDHYYQASGNREPPGELFGIVQGGMYEDLRIESLQRLQEREFPGYAIGGLAVGESEEERIAVLEALCGRLPACGPATSWASAIRTTSSPRCCAGWICSIV